MTVQFANGELRQYQLVDDVSARTWTLKERSTTIAALEYEAGTDATVRLTGHIAEDAVEMRLQRIDTTKFPVY
jgi:hypothetical protein